MRQHESGRRGASGRPTGPGMGRAGRYTLAVMAWIAVYAGWSSVLGLVIAAVTGERLDDGDRIGPTVGLGVSTLFTVVLPLVPTLVALWFNDWLRDGAPSRADRERASERGTAQEAGSRAATPTQPAATAPGAPVDHPVAVPRATRAESSSAVVAAVPLGVPERADPAPGAGGFPVAPVLRGGDEAPAAALADPTPLRTSRPLPTSAPEPAPEPAGAAADPVIDPDDPLGVGDLGLTGLGRG